MGKVVALTQRIGTRSGQRSLSSLLGTRMNISISIGPVISLVAGILILVAPRLLSTIVAVYLIVMGVIGLLGLGAWRL